ncbi:hypothetical protein CVPH_0520 [Abyssogena phaseoliformis symbiont OG214]|nr:hypothetical protein CVPH_0520 [Abyssogena phaseoliformis symbiont OG214]
MTKANKIKTLLIITSTLFALTLNVNAKSVDDKPQDNLKQLKELITSRLNFVHRLSSKGIESKLLISELTTLRFLQDAYIQILVDNNRNNGLVQLKNQL